MEGSIYLKRLRVLERSCVNSELQLLLMERCRRDIVFWFENFCWTFDPRCGQPHRPFVLYGFQREFVCKLCEQIESGNDLLVEKSRDMGVSWMILLVFQYYWLFKPGSHFHLGSRVMEFVDRKGDLSSLFEKLRYNLYRLPCWMRPEGFDTHYHDNVFRLINPAHNNVITGESSNEQFARGGRYKAVLFDEFPFWPFAEGAFAAAGQSSPCRLVVGTPYGKHNAFARLRFESGIAVETIHWRLHPHKNAAWYGLQQQRMTEDEIARELDINYHLSVRSRVFNNFGDIHKGDLAFNPHKRVIRAWDFGYHCPVCLFLQFDDRDRLQVLHEEVGDQILLMDFAKKVIASGNTMFPEAVYEDVCDPAGAQKNDKSQKTSIEMLNSLGVYPFYDRSRILDGVELIRYKLSERIEALPALRVDKSCARVIEAFEGGYRYAENGSEEPVQEHPYEDVMDALRYAVVHKCGIRSGSQKRKARRARRGHDRYTGY